MNYIISYTTYDSIGRVLKSGNMKVKNKDSELSAKVALDRFLSSKEPKMSRMIVWSCERDVMDAFGGLLGDIFK